MLHITYRISRRLTIIFLLFLGLLWPSSCYDDIPSKLPSEYTWTPLLAFPIGEADFGLKIPHGFDTALLEKDSISGYPLWDLKEVIDLSGSIGFDFEEVLGEREEVDMAVIRVNTYNGFPIEVEVQAYLEDINGNILDSLFIPLLIMERGSLQGGGKTVETSHTQRDVLFNSERLDVLLQAKRITFKGQLQKVAYFPEYTFKVQLGAILGVVSDL